MVISANRIIDPARGGNSFPSDLPAGTTFAPSDNNAAAEVQPPTMALAAGIGSLFMLIAIVSLCLRFYVRIAFTHFGLWIDDFLALFSTIHLVAHVAISLHILHIGLSFVELVDRARLGPEHFDPNEFQSKALTVSKLARALVVAYQCAVTSVQLSIIALCLRILPRPSAARADSPQARGAKGGKGRWPGWWGYWAGARRRMMVLLADPAVRGQTMYRATAYTLAAVSLFCAICRTVVDILLPRVWYFTFSSALVLDGVIWLLPLPIVITHMRRSSPGKRLQAIAMFAIGLFVCAVAAARLASASNIRGDDCHAACAWLGIYDQLEVGLGVLCSCLPPIQPLLTHWARQWAASFRRLRAWALRSPGPPRSPDARGRGGGGDGDLDGDGNGHSISMASHVGGRGQKADDGDMSLTNTSGWGSVIVRVAERERIEEGLRGKIRVGRGPRGELEIECEGMGVLGSSLPPPPPSLLARMSSTNKGNSITEAPEPPSAPLPRKPAGEDDNSSHGDDSPDRYPDPSLNKLTSSANPYSASSETILSHYPPLSSARGMCSEPASNRSDEALTSTGMKSAAASTRDEPA